MSLYKQFQTNQKLEQEGVVLNYGENSKGQQIEFRVARAGGSNKRYLERMEAKTKPLRRQIQTETVERGTLERVIREVFAETVVLGWSGVEDADGNSLPFNRANCIKLFNDMPDLFADIQEQAQKFVIFRQEILEEDSKN